MESNLQYIIGGAAAAVGCLSLLVIGAIIYCLSGSKDAQSARNADSHGSRRYRSRRSYSAPAARGSKNKIQRRTSNTAVAAGGGAAAPHPMSLYAFAPPHGHPPSPGPSPRPVMPQQQLMMSSTPMVVAAAAPPAQRVSKGKLIQYSGLPTDPNAAVNNGMACEPFFESLKQRQDWVKQQKAADLFRRSNTEEYDIGGDDDSGLLSVKPEKRSGRLSWGGSRRSKSAGGSARNSTVDEYSAVNAEGKPVELCIDVSGLTERNGDTREIIRELPFVQLKTFTLNAKDELFCLQFNEDETLREERLVTMQWKSPEAKQIFQRVTRYVKHVLVSAEGLDGDPQSKLPAWKKKSGFGTDGASARGGGPGSDLALTGDSVVTMEVAETTLGTLKPRYFTAVDTATKKEVEIEITTDGVAIKTFTRADGSGTSQAKYRLEDIIAFKKERKKSVFSFQWDSKTDGIKELVFKCSEFETAFSVANAYTRYRVEEIMRKRAEKDDEADLLVKKKVDSVLRQPKRMQSKAAATIDEEEEEEESVDDGDDEDSGSRSEQEAEDVEESDGGTGGGDDDNGGSKKKRKKKKR